MIHLENVPETLSHQSWDSEEVSHLHTVVSGVFPVSMGEGNRGGLLVSVRLTIVCEWRLSLLSSSACEEMCWLMGHEGVTLVHIYYNRSNRLPHQEEYQHEAVKVNWNDTYLKPFFGRVFLSLCELKEKKRENEKVRNRALFKWQDAYAWKWRDQTPKIEHSNL